MIGILTRGCREPGSYRIPDDVPRNLSHVGVPAKHPLMESLLPERSPNPVCIELAGALFRALDELTKVARCGSALDEQMGVVRHQAVRKKCEPFGPGCTTKLHQREARGSLVVKGRAPLKRAERCEIGVRTPIVEAGNSWGTRHRDTDVATIVPGGSLARGVAGLLAANCPGGSACGSLRSPRRGPGGLDYNAAGSLLSPASSKSTVPSDA